MMTTCVPHLCSAVDSASASSEIHTTHSHSAEHRYQPLSKLSTGATLQIAFDSAAASAAFDSCKADNWFNCEEIKNEQATVLSPRGASVCAALVLITVCDVKRGWKRVWEGKLHRIHLRVWKVRKVILLVLCFKCGHVPFTVSLFLLRTKPNIYTKRKNRTRNSVLLIFQWFGELQWSQKLKRRSKLLMNKHYREHMWSPLSTMRRINHLHTSLIPMSNHKIYSIVCRTMQTQIMTWNTITHHLQPWREGWSVLIKHIRVN